MRRTALWLLAAVLVSGEALAAEETPSGLPERPAGTGVIVHQDGYVLTAHHVVANARRIVIVTSGEIRHPAVVVSADPDQDLALLKIEAVGLSEAALGYAGGVRLGQEVFVFGFPFGLREVSVSQGRVGAVRTKGVKRVFQVDAAINPGNSGGPVFNRSGEVVGIVTTKFSHPSGIVPEGMAFAVPISYATPLLANIQDFDFALIGKTQPTLRRGPLAAEEMVHEMARTTVRIDTLRLLEPPQTRGGQAEPPPNPPKTDPHPAPPPRPSSGSSHDQGPGKSVDPGSHVKPNDPHVAAQQEALLALAQQGLVPPDGMVLIPAGEFLLGAEDGLPDVRPMHKTYLSSYWVEKYEVSNAQYQRCVESGVCSPPKVRQAFEDSQFAQHPVTNITWNQARSYCQWRGRRLPTEAEWEKAARGTDGRRHPWGNGEESINRKIKEQEMRSGGKGTFAVGSVQEDVSPYGVSDVAGNAWEWVKDWYAQDYYVLGPSRDPQGPLRGSFRVFRSGDWSQPPPEMHLSYRGWDEMTYWGPTLGFRCAADAPQ